VGTRAMWNRVLPLLALAVALVMLAGPASASAGGEGSAADMAKVIVSGTVRDGHQEPVPDADIEVNLNGQPFVPHGEGHGHGAGWKSSSDGSFAVEFELPRAQAAQAQVQLAFSKPSYKTIEGVQVPGLFQQPGDTTDLFGHVQATMQRHIGPAFWIALIILVGIYVLIAFEFMHRTLAALLGAALVLTVSYTFGTFNADYFVITYDKAIGSIDWNVIFLLFGMMIIVGILKETGLFQWLAYKAFKMAKGKVYVLAGIMMFVTGIVSAFLDNVTTMLLLTPVLIEICMILKLHPFTMLMPCVLASNFGGTATLIGDPPNIMIGSYAGLTFNDFVVALTPCVLVVMAVQVFMTKFWYGKDYAAAEITDGHHVAAKDLTTTAGRTAASPGKAMNREQRLQQMYVEMQVKYAITNAKLLKIGLIVLAFVIGLFIAHGALHMEVSIAALIGAAILLLLSKMDIVHLLEKDVEWSTLVFFMMLFVIVGAAEGVGLLQIVADWIFKTSQGNLVVAILLIAWVSAFLSAIIDNIPFTATMLPIVAYLTKTMPGAENMVLFWALSLGACFGGNGTLVGASANIVTAGLLEKAGYPVKFRYFMGYGMPVMIVSMIISSFWLIFWLR
jgi:Na+/H+ antiporter NhaD/arsenite permease-like protein